MIHALQIQNIVNYEGKGVQTFYDKYAMVIISRYVLTFL